MSKKLTLEEKTLQDIEDLLKDHVLMGNVYELKSDLVKLVESIRKRDLKIFREAYKEYSIGMYVKIHGAGGLGFSSKTYKITPEEHKKLIANGSWEGFLRWWLEPKMGKEWKSLK